MFCARFGKFSQKSHFQPKIGVNMTEFQNFCNLDTFCTLHWHMTVIWPSTGVAIELGELEIWGSTLKKCSIEPFLGKKPFFGIFRGGGGVLN